MDTKRLGLWFDRLLWWSIGLINIYDAYLTIEHKEHIMALEKNPIGLWLIDYFWDDPSVFVAIKLTGTMIAMKTLLYIYSKHRDYYRKIAIPVACFQLWLLYYLTLHIG